MSDPIPAATLVLFRDDGPGPALHLFVERARSMAFAAGAVVFPGGRVDEGDRRLAVRFPGLDADDAASRIAAIRETIEETGVAVGITPQPSAQVIAKLRAWLADHVPFGDLLAAERLELELGALVPFARWRPNFPEARVFDTRFYLARAPANQAASVDQTENVRLFWARAADILEQGNRGEVQIIFPTRRNLERLAELRDFEIATNQAHALPQPPPMITPWIEERDGEQCLCIPEGLGYPRTYEPMREVRRG